MRVRLNIFVDNIVPLARAEQKIAPTQQGAQRQALASTEATTPGSGSTWGGSSLQVFWPKTGLSAVIRATNRLKWNPPAWPSLCLASQSNKKAKVAMAAKWRQVPSIRGKGAVEEQVKTLFQARPNPSQLSKRPASRRSSKSPAS
jgi:hypothetical protein